jgi:small subunit ribosomal protein S6
VNDYEMVYVLSPRLSSDEGEQASKWVEGVIRESGGEVLSMDLWGRRRLAYPIKHQFEGTYVYTTFRIEPTSTVRIESQLGLSEDVLRHLIIRGIIEGGKPEAQSARLMAANRPPVTPPPPAVTEASATGEAAAEAATEPADAASEAAPVEAATPTAEEGATEAAPEASAAATEPTAEVEATDTATPAEPEPARAE